MAKKLATMDQYHWNTWYHQHMRFERIERRIREFPPEKLFANGEQGALYEPWDLTTLYQDSAGTTPVTADADPVGLMLDKSQGLALGPELVANGAFDDSSVWNVLGDWTISGGVATKAAGSVSSFLTQPAQLITGKTYAVTYTVVSSSQSGILRVDLIGGTAVTGADRGLAGVGTYTEYLVAAEGNNEVRVSASDVFAGAIDNISVRELPGNHATQSVAESRRLYKTNGSERWLLDDLVDDGINAQLPDLGTNATLAYADGAGVTILTGQTISGSTPLPTVAETYGVIYLDRPFAAGETESVTAYLNGLRGA